MVESPTFFHVSTNGSLVSCTARAEEDGKSYNVTIEWISDEDKTLVMCSNSNSCVLHVSGLDVGAIGNRGTLFHCIATHDEFNDSSSTTVYCEGSYTLLSNRLL